MYSSNQGAPNKKNHKSTSYIAIIPTFHAEAILKRDKELHVEISFFNFFHSW